MSVEFVLLFLGLPAAAWGVGASLVASGYAELRSKGLPIVEQGTPGGRILQYFAFTMTSVVFGLVLWLQVASLEASFGTLDATVTSLLIWVGVMFAVVSAVAIACQALTARVRLDQFVGTDFGRVLVLTVVWEALSVFGLVIAMLVFGRISAGLEDAGTLTTSQANQLVMALQVYALSTAAAPIGAAWSARARALSEPKAFVRALARTEAGAVPAIVGLLWAVLVIQGV